MFQKNNSSYKQYLRHFFLRLPTVNSDSPYDLETPILEILSPSPVIGLSLLIMGKYNPPKSKLPLDLGIIVQF